MKKALLILLAFAGHTFYVNSQCDIDFSSNNLIIQFTNDIVNGTSGGGSESASHSFDIWDNSGASLDCSSAGGGNDITFEFDIIHAFDKYGIDGVIDAYAGTTHDVIQNTSGLRGSIPLGNSGTNETSAGDVRGYSIQVTFASHLTIYAKDVTVNMNSINTRGSAFESTSLVFLNESGTAYGTATFDGYYGSGSGGASNSSCTAPAAGTPWTTSGKGVFVAASTGTVDRTDPCNTAAGTSGPDDGKDVAAVADAGLANSDKVGGFVFTVYLEDVAATINAGSPAPTNTSTSFTSTLNGMTIAAAALLPVSLVDFEAREKGMQVVLNWETGSELNNDFFEIQRSIDGKAFKTIGKILGNGTSNTANLYSYQDKNPLPGIQYYRLKQVDFDGKFSHSEIKSVNFTKETITRIFPTDASEEITIVTPALEERTSYRIANSFGQIVQEGDLELFVKQQKLSIGQIPTGIYFFQIGNTTNANAMKFFKK